MSVYPFDFHAYKKGQISRYFYRYEVACRCGCGFQTMDGETLMIADFVREIEGGPVECGSGARCDKHNKAEGGAPDSDHPKGLAMDLHVKNPRVTFAALQAKFEGKYAFGLYPWGVHVAASPKCRRWISDDMKT